MAWGHLSLWAGVWETGRGEPWGSDPPDVLKARQLQGQWAAGSRLGVRVHLQLPGA